MGDVVTMNEYAITVDGEAFNLTQIPGADTKLVQTRKKDVLGTIDLGKMMTSLGRCADLLYLAYCGVAGFGELRGNVNLLEDKFGELCRDTGITLSRFRAKIAEMLGKLNKTFTFLTKGQEKIGLAFMAQCADLAIAMATEADVLAGRYDKLADDATKLASDTQVQEGKTAAERQQLLKELEDLKAANASAQKLSDSMGELKKKMENLYAEAKENADTASDRAFGLQIASAIMQPLSQGLGAFAGSFARMQTGLPPNLPAAPADKPADKQQADAAAKVETAKKTEQTAKSEEEAAKTTLDKANTGKNAASQNLTAKENAETLAKEKVKTSEDELAKKKDDETLKTKVQQAKDAVSVAEKEKDKAKADLTAAETDLTKAQKALEEKQKAAQTAADAVRAAQTALDGMAKEISRAADSYMEIAKSYEEEKREYLDKLLKFQESEARALADMASYAVKMTTVTNQAEVKKTVSDSLMQATKALNTVAQILREAAKFWRAMESACKHLASGGVQSTLKAYIEAEPDPIARVKLYQEDDFKKEIISYMAGWKGLELVCEEYVKEAEKTEAAVHKNISDSPTLDQSLNLTITLGKKLSLDASRAEAEARSVADKTKSLVPAA